MRKVESLGRRARCSTPIPFARALLDLAECLCGPGPVAVLWVEPKSNYYRLLPCSLLWNARRNARNYPGPHPVICHPPCGPWGKYRSVSQESKEDGRIAMEIVHRWGGIVEQPVGSSLFKEYGMGGVTFQLDQYCFGHLAKKNTILYMVGKLPFLRDNRAGMVPSGVVIAHSSGVAS